MMMNTMISVVYMLQKSPLLILGFQDGEAGGHGVNESPAVTTAVDGATAVGSYAEPFLFYVVVLGIVAVFIGIILCLYRMLRGPHLADRALAGDVLSMHVVGLVILLAISLRTVIFLDAALVVAIMGFASTLAFAQYIGARGESDL